jgi:hypothetical protein
MQATTPMAGTPRVQQAPPFERRETGWRASLTSWQLGAILVVALAVGLVGIFSAHPFASAGISERVSRATGQPASCESVGAAQVGGRSSTIYKCTIGLQHRRLAQCFTVSGGEVRQLGGTRELGC